MRPKHIKLVSIILVRTLTYIQNKSSHLRFFIKSFVYLKKYNHNFPQTTAFFKYIKLAVMKPI